MAHVALGALDTSLMREWREHGRLWRAEDRSWRAEDIDIRNQERRAFQEQEEFLDDLHRWREEDMKQRRLDNARYLWTRFSEVNRREVEEKSEHLRSLSWLTGLITSFTMTSPVEFNVIPQNISLSRLVPYAMSAAIVPTLMSTSTIICVYLLGCILKMGKWFVSEFAEEEFMMECQEYAERAHSAEAPPAPSQTFQLFWKSRCKRYWKTSFSLFFWGISFFLALLCTMAFIKFNSTDWVALVFAVVIGLSFFLWLWFQLKWGFYLQKSRNEESSSVGSSHRVPENLDPKDPYKWHLKPVSK